MTLQELEEIRKRCDAATEGPWEQEDCRENHIATATGMDIAHAPKQINAQFIAHARTDVPALLAEVERLRGLIKAAELTSRPCPVRGVAFGCPWCGLRCGRDRMIHASDCPAFTPEGEVK